MIDRLNYKLLKVNCKERQESSEFLSACGVLSEVQVEQSECGTISGQQQDPKAN